jgi:divinyl protochlorophyllide a 8-vinyl-reductase
MRVIGDYAANNSEHSRLDRVLLRWQDGHSITTVVSTRNGGAWHLLRLSAKEAQFMSEESGVHAAGMRSMLDAIQAVAGDKGKNMVLRHAGLEEYIETPPPLDESVLVPTDHYKAVCRALLEVFGKGSRAMLVYAGESSVLGSMEGLPSFFSGAMRLMPGGMRKKAALKLLARQAGKVTGIPPKVEYEKDRVLFHAYNCEHCEGYESDEPMCFYMSGVLKGFVEWATGKPHKVTEIECSAMGAEACVYEIVEV